LQREPSWRAASPTRDAVASDWPGPRKLTGIPSSFALSPGGRQIALEGFEGDTGPDPEIYVINSDGTGLRQLTYNTREDIDPTWSPDGRRIVFTSRRDRNFEIYVMNADGSDQTNISRSPAWDEAPAWQPAD
jgi:Tol biopolymer transport system component